MKIPFVPSAPLNPFNNLGRLAFLGATLFIGQWFFSDIVHFPGGGIGLVLTGAGVWWISKPISAKFDSPISSQGWIRKCQQVLEDFETLDGEKAEFLMKERFNALEKIISRPGPQNVGLVSSIGGSLPDEEGFNSALAVSQPFELTFSNTLPLADDSWQWPEEFLEKDALLYSLPLPLKAADLLWLEHVPEDQPAWALVTWNDLSTWSEQLKALQAQLPHRWEGRVLRLGDDMELSSSQATLLPVRRLLENPKKNLDKTKQRLLSNLHARWQAELENLRREQFRSVQHRSQWLVAGAVFASPVPSTDLLSVAVVNGLMIKDMTRIWSCPWKPEVLQVAARQLAGAAIAQGVIEWSGQALLSAAKLDGSSWFAAGALQALNAAYLTRVVGRSMADWLALNSGVKEPDLEALKRDASHLVAKAAEEERVNWPGFIKQASGWLTERAVPVSLLPSGMV